MDSTIFIRYGTTETQYCSQYNISMQTIWHHDKNSSKLNLYSIWMRFEGEQHLGVIPKV